MCIIIDANVAAEIPAQSDDAKPIIKSITSGEMKVVSGHQLKVELLKTAFRPIYQELLLSGKLIEFDGGAVAKELSVIANTGLRSNDGHVIALARISGARILFSRDVDLHSDFKNAALVAEPRGSVYQTKAHEHLLKQKDACECH